MREMPSVNQFLDESRPLDLRAALEACIALSGEEGTRIPATDGHLDSVESTLCVFMERLETKGIGIWDVFSRMVKNDHALKERATANHAEGGLRGVDSRNVLQGAAISSLASRRLSRFLPVTYRPEIQGEARQVFTELLFLMDLLVDSLSPDGSDKLLWLHLSRAIGSACKQEILRRLAEHPTSHEVYQVVSRNDANALQALLRRVKQISWNVPPYNDDSEKESAGAAHLWTAVTEKLAGSAAEEQAHQNILVLRLAMDGKFETVPREVRANLIDEARRASARKRAGDGKHLPVFESSDDDDTIGDESRDVDRLTFEVLLEELKADDKLMGELGPAHRLLRFCLEHPDEDYTEKQLAEYLDVTDRTVRNYRIRLQRVKKWLQ